MKICYETQKYVVIPLILSLFVAIFMLTTKDIHASCSSCSEMHNGNEAIWQAEDDFALDIAAAVAVSFGETIQGSIDFAGEIDSYTFSANAGDMVMVRVSRTSEDLGPKVRVYGPHGVKLCEAETAYGSTVEIASCTLPCSGTYVIQVT